MITTANRSSSYRRFAQIALLFLLLMVMLYHAVNNNRWTNTGQETKRNSGQIRQDEHNIYGRGCPENPFRGRFITLLRFWEAIAARRNISEYFLCFGSILGAFRNGDVIPYDHDIDICMLKKDIYKLEPDEEKRPFKYDDGQPHMILQRHCHNPVKETPRQDCSGNVVLEHVDACSILEPCGRILLGSPPFLDVFAIKDEGKELLDEYKGVKHERNVILPVKPCEFLGITTKCPSNSAAYLKRYYGKEFATKPHYVCKENKWVATGKNVDPIAVPL